MSSSSIYKRTDPGILVQLNKITPEQLAEAIEDSGRNGLNVLEFMVRDKIVFERDVHEAYAHGANIPFVDIANVEVLDSVARLIKFESAREMNIIPYNDDGNVIYVATSTVSDITLETKVRALIPGRSIQLVHAFIKDLERRVNDIYNHSKQAEVIASEVSRSQETRDRDRQSNVAAEESGGQISRTVRLIIEDGIRLKASDIHVEPHELKSQVRYEVDGIVQNGGQNNLNIHANIIAAIKVQASMGLDDRIRSSGRIEFMYIDPKTKKRDQVDLRVESLPTVRGQRITMRILDNSTARLPLASLGFSIKNYEMFESAFTQPIGLILLNGPTGAGKSTTLYSTLNQVYTPEKTIYTVENPVEYKIDGISQVQVNEDAGMTFGEALKGFMRMAPKILLVGEIRDAETANLAIDFALTGHLVLSTLHANDAPLAVSRLIKMGVDPFLVGDSLECSVAQRLCRVLCRFCKEPYEPELKEWLKVGVRPRGEDGKIPQALREIFRPRGCDECNHTGYKGRTSIHEVMLMNDEISEMIAEGAPASNIRKAAVSNGMIPLLKDGIDRIAMGETSIEEIARVIRVRM